MNIWFVSIFENTPLDDNLNTRYNSLVLEATKNQHQVTFWSSTFRHNVKQQRYEEFKEVQINEQVRVNFVPATAYEKNISFGRMKSHYDLGKSMIAHFEQETSLPKVIVVAFPPISTAFEIIGWAKKKNIPVIIDIIDPWPDVFMEHMNGVKKQLVQFGTYPLRKKTAYVFSNATAIIAISKQYIDWAKTYNSKLQNSAYFYPAVQFDEIKRQLKAAEAKAEKNTETTTIIYAGSLGYSYDIPTILEAAKRLEIEEPRIKFIIAGDGPQKTEIEAYQKNHNNLKYLGRLSKEKLMEEYYLADIGLTQHIKGATQSVTYKLFDLLACGLPIMNSLESEMKSIIVDNEVGFHNHPGDATQLAKNIVKCHNDRQLMQTMKTKALTLTAEKGDAAVVYKRALNFIKSQTN